MELLQSNLYEVFSGRDPQRRWTAIARTYTEDVTFTDPEAAFVGRQALNDQAQKLLDGVTADFVFEEDWPRYVGTDIAVLAWRFGPPGHRSGATEDNPMWIPELVSTLLRVSAHSVK